MDRNPLTSHDPQALALALLGELTELQTRMAAEAASTLAQWSPHIHRAEFAASAGNMAEWLALRRSDLSRLQGPLATLGLSTLGRLDAHVGASVQAVMAALSRIAGAAPQDFPPRQAFADGDAVLSARRDALFGAQEPGDPRTRVMVTLPTEAGTDGGALIAALVMAGICGKASACAFISASRMPLSLAMSPP